jgi:hypothetical protein
MLPSYSAGDKALSHERQSAQVKTKLRFCLQVHTQPKNIGPFLSFALVL